jgi:hypothetical protein
MLSLRSLASLALVTTLSATATAATESLHREHVFPAVPGTTVVVDVSFHNVEISATPGDTVEVSIDLEFSGSAAKVARLLKDFEPVFEQEANRILIRSVRRGGLSWGALDAKGRVVVSMPPDLDLVVDTSSGATTLLGDFGRAGLTVDASSGSLRLDGAADHVVADASSGSVRLALSRPVETVRVDTSSGSVDLIGGARSVAVDTSSGSIGAEDLLGDATFDTSSGSVTAAWASVAPRSQVTVDTSSGGVRLSFPAGTSIAGRVDTSSGGIRTDFPGEISDRGGRLDLHGGADAVLIRVDTSSGGVKLLAH